MRIALATSAALPELEAEDLPLLDALLERDVEAVPAVWNSEDLDWSSFDAVVIRSTWDYADQRDHFLAWTEEISSALPLFNDAAAVRWNTHKGYLLQLERSGIPIVPTSVATRDGSGQLETLLDQAEGEAVVKLAVSAGGRNVYRIGRDAEGQRRLDDLLEVGDVLVQPFVAGVQSEGELSVFVIDGQVTHAVRKRSASGDFRTNFDRAVVREDVDDVTAALALRVVHAAPVEPPLYARVDLLRTDEQWLVVELELVEPALFFTHAPAAAARMADALLERLQGPS